MDNDSSLAGLQTDGQRQILDTSSGKSSVLEALTEIPFPRNEDLCTRFATEITLQREAMDRLIVKVVPDDARPVKEQEKIKAFSQLFAMDVLSIEIEGPSRPHVTLVDIQGLISTSVRGVSEADITMKIRKYDPKGERTLGIITKVDDVPVGSGKEAKLLELAKNEVVFFKLGWHVVKNRKFQERCFTIEERNASEAKFFAGSIFGNFYLPASHTGM
ncbi:P-loop containing nucleoside triphosphate hydrolase protein [Xylaria acuta]|nr:P-loop containing nucleoside triphosphate hydrolase protein [Xylaria acuta]